MPEIKRTTKQILEEAQRALDTAEFGYDTLTKNPSKTKVSGLMNVAVFGVSTTAVLQNLRHIEPKFDEWYKPYEVEMDADRLMKYFWKLRSEILKEGRLQLKNSAVFNFCSSDLARIPPPPPNVKVKSLFMGDNLGCSGYELVQEDGSIVKYYVVVPTDMMKTRLHFPDPPETHLGHDLPDRSVETLSRLYLDYLKRMLKDAYSRFDKTEIK